MELPRAAQRSVSVEIYHSTQNDPLSLAKDAVKRVKKARKERNPYDKVWLFFDHDNHPRWQAGFEVIVTHGFEAAYTAICFEHWLILHYENCGRVFQNADEALTYLRKFWPAYHKTRSKAFDELRDKLETAMERAAVLVKNQDEDTPIHLRNPYFTIPDLVRYFEGLKGNA